MFHCRHGRVCGACLVPLGRLGRGWYMWMLLGWIGKFQQDPTNYLDLEKSSWIHPMRSTDLDATYLSFARGACGVTVLFQSHVVLNTQLFVLSPPPSLSLSRARSRTFKICAFLNCYKKRKTTHNSRTPVREERARIQKAHEG